MFEDLESVAGSGEELDSDETVDDSSAPDASGSESESDDVSDNDCFSAKSQKSDDRQSDKRNKFLTVIRAFGNRFLRNKRRVQHQPIEFGKLCQKLKKTKYYKKLKLMLPPKDRNNGQYWTFLRQQTETYHNKRVTRLGKPARRRRTKSELASGIVVIFSLSLKLVVLYATFHSCCHSRSSSVYVYLHLHIHIYIITYITVGTHSQS